MNTTSLTPHPPIDIGNKVISNTIGKYIIDCNNVILHSIDKAKKYKEDIMAKFAMTEKNIVL